MPRLAVLEPSTQRHALHAQERVWLEKNCYIDLWIGLLQALKLEPLACLGFTIALEFEADQWTFFKPSHEELRELYGIDVQELNIWQPLLAHVCEQLKAGHWPCPEVDSFWLPDTAGTDYRRQHTKTTLAINEIDVEARFLGYFHNAGYYSLEGNDFDGLWQPQTDGLPLYVERVRIDRVVRRDGAALRLLARTFLARHLARRPADNPLWRFGSRLPSLVSRQGCSAGSSLALDAHGVVAPRRHSASYDSSSRLPLRADGGVMHRQNSLDATLGASRVQAAGMDAYHRWAFGGIRQLGAAFELAALHLQWLDAGLYRAADAFMHIAVDAKALILKAARAASTGRPLEVDPLIDRMATAWERGMNDLARA